MLCLTQLTQQKFIQGPLFLESLKQRRGAFLANDIKTNIELETLQIL